MINKNDFNIKFNAFWSNKYLSTKGNISQNRKAVKQVLNHMNDCYTSPTIGLLARKKHDLLLDKSIKRKNLKILKKEVEAYRNIKNAFKKKFDYLFKKTGKARKFLISSESIVLDKVKPIKKDFGRKIFKSLGINIKKIIGRAK